MSYVDELGVVRKKIKALVAREEVLRQNVIDNKTYIGDDYNTTVYTRTKTYTNWKAIPMKFKPSKQMIVGNSKRSKYEV